MILVKNEVYGTLNCDFYRNSKGEIYLTIEQLAKGFGYKTRDAIEKMMKRQPYLYEKAYSVTDSLSGTDSKNYETRLFTKKGIFEIGSLSKTKQGMKFRSWVFDRMEYLEAQELKRQITYEVSKPTQKDLHQAIKESSAYLESENKRFMYPNLNNLLIKEATGLSLKEINARGKSRTTKGLLTAPELKRLETLEKITIGLLEAGKDYDHIKKVITELEPQTPQAPQTPIAPQIPHVEVSALIPDAIQPYQAI